MHYVRLPLGVYQANSYIVIDDDTKECAVIDPGGDFPELKDFLNKKQLVVKYIILTHGHGDHIGAVEALKNDTGAPVCIHSLDADMLKSSSKNHSKQIVGKTVEIVPDQLLEDNTRIFIGSMVLDVIHTPGHTPGGICIKCENALFSGDTLFAGSIGRTDLEGGSYDEIIKSIKSKLLILPEETEVLPGHGPSSTLLIEKKRNPFLR